MQFISPSHTLDGVNIDPRPFRVLNLVLAQKITESTLPCFAAQAVFFCLSYKARLASFCLSLQLSRSLSPSFFKLPGSQTISYPHQSVPQSQSEGWSNQFSLEKSTRRSCRLKRKSLSFGQLPGAVTARPLHLNWTNMRRSMWISHSSRRTLMISPMSPKMRISQACQHSSSSTKVN